MKKAIIFTMCFFIASCMGSPVHRTIKYGSIQSNIGKNNENFLSMRVGLDKAQTRTIMGSPERSEGYNWGSAWLYRTSLTGDIYRTSDADYTPIVFDNDGKVIGWGRNFFTEQVKRYDIEIRSTK